MMDEFVTGTVPPSWRHSDDRVSEPVISILNPIGASHLSLLHGFNVQALM
jgi:hypothetical protein